MKPFLYQVAASFYARYGAEITRLAFVFPNRRTGLFFQKYLSEVAQRPIFSPSILTINDLFTRLARRQSADRISLLFSLYAHYVRLSGSDESFDDFLYWGEMLLSDFDDIDKYRVDAQALFRNLSDIKEIERDFDFLTPEQLEAIRMFWSGFHRRAHVLNRQRFLEVWQVLYNLYQDFRAALSAEGKAYEGMIFRDVAEKVSRDEVEALSYERIVFVGLNALSVAEETFLDKLRDWDLADFYWDVASAQATDAANKASFFVMRNAKRFPSCCPLPVEPSREAKIEVIGVPSGVGQAKQLHNLLRQWFPEEAVPAEEALRTAVVLPEESLLLPVLHAIPASVGSINVTMGYPLAGTPVASLVEAVMALQLQVRWIDRLPLFHYSQVLPLLNHRYLSAADPECVGTLIKEITESNRIYLEPAFLARTPLLALLFQPITQVADFAAYLIRILEALNERLTAQEELQEEEPTTKGRLSREIEQEFIFHYFATVNRMQEVMREHAVEMRLDTFFRLLKRMADRVTIPFQGEPLSGLQIMGVLETRALDFDRLVILSMNEGVFPQHKVANSFIPYHLRKGFGLPTYEHQDSIWAYHFYRLIERAEQVSLVYDTRSTGMRSGEVSRFVHQLRYHYGWPLRDKLIVYDVAAQSAQPLVVRKDSVACQHLSAYLENGEKALSASALNRYLDCPLKFYLTDVEGLREEDRVTERVESDTFGSILHKVMEILYRPLQRQVVTSDLLKKIRKDKRLLQQTVAQAFASEFFKSDQVKPLHGLNFLNGEIIRKYVEQILRQDDRLTPFTYGESELLVKGQIALTDGRQVALKGFIDRVDEVNGVKRIVDYKTGAPELTFSSIESLFDADLAKRPKEVMQVFFYAYLYLKVQQSASAQPVQPCLYGVRNLFKDPFDSAISQGVSRGKKERVEDCSPLIEAFEEALRHCLDALFDPDVPFAQTTQTDRCAYCPFKDICGR